MPDAPSRLRVEHLSDAVGIGTTRPRLSWWLPERACEQVEYRIRADNCWDSGRVQSADSVLVEYAGGAYELLFTDTMPSWLYMIERGATTVWERWDGVRPDGTPFESLNHYSKGAVVSFLHRYVAGIRLLEDGVDAAYRHFRVEPSPGAGITWAQAEHDSPYGRIESSWRLSGDAFELVVAVPPGTTAEIVLPDGTTKTVSSGHHTLRGSADDPPGSTEA